MKNVYLCESNCTVHKNGDYLTVRKYGSKLSDISLVGVRSILVFGNTQLTTQAITALLENEIDILYLTMSGRLKGRLQSNTGSNIVIRIAQYKKWLDEETRLKVAKGLVINKLEKQLEVIVRYKYRSKSELLQGVQDKLVAACKAAGSAESIGEVMGAEGSGAAAYFTAFRELLPLYDFSGRVRRPAYDPINALLNLTYAFLKNEIALIAQAYSLDLQLGFLHTVRSGRDSLVYDLMEGFRPIFADRFVLMLFNKSMVSAKDFEDTEEGLRLKADSLRRYCVIFQKHLYEDTYGNRSWMQNMELEVQKFRRLLMSEKEA